MTGDSIEIYYQAVSNLSFFTYVILTGCCLVFLCYDFFHSKKNLWLVGASFSITHCFIYYMPYVVSNFLAYFFSVGAALIVMLLLEKQNRKIKIYLAATFFAIRWHAACIANMIADFILREISLFLYHHLDAADPSMWKWQFAGFCIFLLLRDLMQNGLIFGIAVMIRRSFVQKNMEMKLQEFTMLLVPSVSGMVFCILFQMYQAAAGKEIYDVSVFLQVIWILMHAVMLTAVVSTAVLYQSLLQKQEQEKRNLVLKKQMQDIRKHIDSVEQVYEEIRGIRHDIGNHVAVMESLMEQNRYNDAKEYLEPLKKEMGTFEFPAKTGNPVTDIILFERAKEARDKGVAFTSEFYYPQKEKPDIMDVSVVLNNALGNALEAAKEGGYVRIFSALRKNIWLVQVENSFGGKLELGKNGLPETTKEDKKTHGFGLKNIKAVAEKYYGTVSIEQKDVSIEQKDIEQKDIEQKDIEQKDIEQKEGMVRLSVMMVLD